ncbi:carbohydrate-binding family V/XII [Gilvimarinus sp. SDUM040013]|uniref:Carbohydrate-binding family V/XII n=1 Tax=Gilvimarinus gilvus TaxID=3058038 RepID=A0ABU4S156_9GAMM|nr:carbohydrate-binding family V/XII [Gilvimarinus sp. SDUM040013]MDO3387159.1 carbohydrate-binding family V/XII [Gilvimarinus sp. SDUM040013]MDX6850902.1 carbohydrate-binding family V/XII [Gilvimarinus sp. SDUM040013]
MKGTMGIKWVAMLCLALSAFSVHAIDWPQQITAKEGSVVVYQPQPESMQGNRLSGRAAMSLELKGQPAPIFGAFWFNARIDTNQDAGTVFVRDLKVTKVRWPDSSEADEARFTEVVESALPQAGFVASLDALSASLESAEIEQKSLTELKTDAPVILFRDELSVLLMFDGEPRFSDVENSHYERALNSPFVVVRDKKSKITYLSSGNFWYSAAKPTGPYTSITNPPADLVKMLPKTEEKPAEGAVAPAIVVATQPTELIVTQGEARWKSLAGGKLLYVENTETPWLRDIEAGKMYLLLSGRWFSANNENGPWQFARPDQLPKSFSEIPPDSDIGGVRTAVAGTDEAEDAMLDAAIPQTTAVKRSEATLEVSYDGKPEFASIDGTTVAYAVNTGAQVLKIDNHFYAVDNGVWFESNKATGPWTVADNVPSEKIKQIPPSSPVYNTTYVEVYDSTPDVVYVGYRPGYLWSFPYYGVPVYGTGWYYPPYWGATYYPRPPTWGFNVGYNPWTGWNYGVSWSNGFFSFGVSWGGGWSGPYRPWGCCHGWYGGGYRPPVVINTGNINIGNNINVGNRVNVNNRLNNTSIKRKTQAKNIYQRPGNVKRNASSATIHNHLKQAKTLNTRDNNVFADKHGNVARKVGDNWQTRDNGSWNNHQDLTIQEERIPQRHDNIGSQSKEMPRPQFDNHLQRDRQYNRPSTRPTLDRGGLNRDFGARQRGMNRSMNRPMNRQMPVRGGGGFRR